MDFFTSPRLARNWACLVASSPSIGQSVCHHLVGSNVLDEKISCIGTFDDPFIPNIDMPGSGRVRLLTLRTLYRAFLESVKTSSGFSMWMPNCFRKPWINNNASPDGVKLMNSASVVETVTSV